MLMLNVYTVYMRCDNNCHDDDFINTLNNVYIFFNSYVVLGGDMNVDPSRTSPNSRILIDLFTNLLTCIDLFLSNVPYTFIDRNTNTSKIYNMFFLLYHNKT